MSSITGLNSLEVSKRLKEYGHNEILQARKTSLIELFLRQFQSVLVLLLIGASLVSLLLGETLDGLFIILIVLLNAVLGFMQEYKADQAIDKLKDLTVAYVRLIRDGKETRIDSRELVPGDVILLEAGDRVPADANIIEGLHCEVDESILTGESMPVEKRYAETEENTLYLGTTIVKGRCRAQVKLTGMQTKFGSIARDLMSIKEEKTPLQKQLDKLGSQLGLLAVGASSIVFILSLIYKQPLLEVILTSISLSVAAVPEGLPAVITITLALGMQRMARGKAILRKLTAIETLGSSTVIATDKTGTLTTGKMKVTDIWFDDAQKDINKLDTDTSETLELLFKVAVNCNNASLIFKHDHGDVDSLGDPTEGALLIFAHHQKIDVEKIKQIGEIKEEFAFDADIKLMSTI